MKIIVEDVGTFPNVRRVIDAKTKVILVFWGGRIKIIPKKNLEKMTLLF